jgi:hypothetical protein
MNRVFAGIVKSFSKMTSAFHKGRLEWARRGVIVDGNAEINASHRYARGEASAKEVLAAQRRADKSRRLYERLKLAQATRNFIATKGKGKN